MQNDHSIQRGGRTYTTTVSNESQLQMNPMYAQVSQKETLFPTAIIKVMASSGTVYTLRALLDQCSDGSFIKTSVAKMLGLTTCPIQQFNVTGLEDVVTSTVNSATQFNMVVQKTELIKVEAFVVSTLVGVLPRAEVKWPENIFKNIQLADPTYATPGNVDIMLGGAIFSNIILEGVLKESGYLAQNTKLGWIISGRSDKELHQPIRQASCFHTQIIQSVDPNHDEILKKFWEIEEPPQTRKHLTAEESKCEEIFKNSYRRLPDGRVEVKLPFKEDPAKVLGTSRNLAVARWIAMEKKLDRDPGLKEDYMKAMQEHWDLGHMARVETKESDHGVISSDGTVKYSCYYIPHHAVVKPESTTTKTRIVFDASAKTSTKVSLNDVLMIGPIIQESLLVRILKWRQHRYVLRGDITKMYRQIRVNESDHDYQRMVFRFNKADPIEDFRLVTLTFGTASAPYMAMKSIQQVAEDEATNFPIGSEIAKNDFHVDDLLTGSDSIESVKEIYQETKNLLKSAGFPMRKWLSNDNRILETIPEEEREIKSKLIQIDDYIKTLGLGWLPLSDQFFFESPAFNVQELLTKRTFLSQAAKLFDPLGWLGPVVIKPKIMFQALWKEQLKWDDKISTQLAKEWEEFREKLKTLEEIRICRWYGFTTCGYVIELHGFSDASMKAYGAVIYIKSTDAEGKSQVQLVLAKSRVAPVAIVRLPRLELCGGALLAELMNKVGSELKIETRYYWTDSSITLAWADSSPDKHHIFVANRIADIQSLSNSKSWRHVSKDDNPADCLSRGLSPDELKDHELWWHGPKWLIYPKEQWPN